MKKEYRCTLPKDEEIRDRNAINGFVTKVWGTLLKTMSSLLLVKGEDDKAEQLLNLAAENGFQPQQKSDVAWMTLTALFRERIESGLDMPSDVFSTWIKDKTKITRK